MNMARRRKYPRRRTYRKKRRRPKPKIPLEQLAGLIAIPFTPPGSNRQLNIIKLVQANDWSTLGRYITEGFLGFSDQRPFNALQTINPLDFSTARWWKILFWAGVVSKVRKRLVRVPMDKIPFLGKFVS